MKSGIYQITNRRNGNRYIGSSYDIARRWASHRKCLRAGTHHSRYLQAAWNKDGEEAFDFSVLIYCQESGLIPNEQEAMDLHRPAYNMRKIAGSSLGCEQSHETKQRLSARMKALWTDPEYRERQSDSNRAKMLDPEVRAIHSSAVRTALAKPSARENLSRAQTEAQNRVEVKEKIRAMAKARWSDPDYRERHSAANRAQRRDGSKVDESVLSAVEAELAAGASQRLIAKTYGIDQSTVSDIKNRKHWRQAA